MTGDVTGDMAGDVAGGMAGDVAGEREWLDAAVTLQARVQRVSFPSLFSESLF